MYKPHKTLTLEGAVCSPNVTPSKEVTCITPMKSPFSVAVCNAHATLFTEKVTCICHPYAIPDLVTHSSNSTPISEEVYTIPCNPEFIGLCAPSTTPISERLFATSVQVPFHRGCMHALCNKISGGNTPFIGIAYS